MTDVDRDRLQIASVFVFMGFLMTLGMTTVLLIEPTSGQFHTATDIQGIIDGISGSSTGFLKLQLASIVFDSFFIIGYIGIFYGLYLLTKNRDPFFSGLGLVLGISTGILDLVENAIHVALLSGVPNGWSPDSAVFAGLWTITFSKDLASYMTGMIFIIILLVTISNPPNIRGPKIVLLILVALYVITGAIAIMEPSFLLVRNLSFMIDMGVGSVLLHRIAQQF